MSSAGVGHFYGFKSSHRKKFDRKGWGKTSFNFHDIVYIEVGKNDFASNPRSFKLFLFQGALFVSVDRSCNDGKIQISTDSM